MAIANCKDECETLMSAVLPLAEQMLSEHGTLRPFGSTLSTSDQVVDIGSASHGLVQDEASLLAEYRDSFREGAQRGELKATALVYAASSIAPGAAKPEWTVAVQLDHRDDYSIVVNFPYRFTETGELVIDEPFASEGEHKIFDR